MILQILSKKLQNYYDLLCIFAAYNEVTHYDFLSYDMAQDSIVGIAAWYRLDGGGI